MKNNNRIFIHIPKTAGTYLKACVGGRVNTYYYSWNSPPEEHNILWGHYTQEWITKQFKGKTACVIREPASQYVSNYYHYARNPSVLFEPERKAIIPGLTLEQFIEHPEMKNYQSKFIQDIDKIDCVLIQEDIYYDKFSEWLGRGVSKGRQKLNTGNYDQKEIERVKDLVYKIHKKDVKLYEKAKLRNSSRNI